MRERSTVPVRYLHRCLFEIFSCHKLLFGYNINGNLILILRKGGVDNVN